MKNRVQLVLLIAVLLLVHPASGHLPGPLDSFGSSVSEANSVEVRPIMFPVAGPANYGDTFGACRDNCTRLHQGVDIFAPKLTPLIAAADGRIVSERRNASKKAGNKLTIEDADGWRYVYVHLNNDTPGTDDNANPQSWIAAGDLRAGDMVRAGQVIGYLGDSGNAEDTPPHLHFEIIPPGGASINPTPSVTAAHGRSDLVPATELWLDGDLRSGWEPIVEEAYEDLAGRSPTDDELDSWANRLGLGLGTEADLIADLAMAAPYREPEGMALRAYVATFGRLPSDEVLTELAAVYRDGGSATDLAERIVDSNDYRELRPTAPGAELDVGDIAALAESNEMKVGTWHLLQIVRAYRAAAGRLPTGEEIDGWTAYLEADGLMVDVVTGALEDALPAGEPRNAGLYTPTELGYTPGVNVRQGPIDLDPSTDSGDGGAGTVTFGEPDFDMELTVEESDDGTDVANLTVRIPIDELEANGDGDAELTIELQLTPGDGSGEEPEATADVQVVPGAPSDPASTADDPAVDDADQGPVVSTPTTRRPSAAPAPTPRPTSTTTTAAPTTTTTTTAPPATSPPETAPATTTTSTTTTSTPATSTPATTATIVEPPTTTASTDPATETTAADDQPPTTCADGTDPEAPADGSTSTTSCSPPDDPDTDEGIAGDETTDSTTEDGTVSEDEDSSDIFTDDDTDGAEVCDEAPEDAAPADGADGVPAPEAEDPPCAADGADPADGADQSSGASSSAQEPSAALRLPAVERPSGARRRRTAVLTRP